MVDKSDNAFTLTYSANAQMDTGVEKFTGVPTLLMDGTGDRVQVVGADFVLSAGVDFTCEAWIYPTAAAGGTEDYLAQYLVGGNQRAWRFSRVAGGGIQCAFYSGGGSSPAFGLSTSGALNVNEWNYLVIQRENDVFTLWHDGADRQQTTQVGWGSFDSSAEIHLGSQNNNVDVWTGNIGPLRFTIGEALYPDAPATICIPTGTFPES